MGTTITVNFMKHNGKFGFFTSERQVATWDAKNDLVAYQPLNGSDPIIVGKVAPEQLNSIETIRKIEKLVNLDNLAAVRRQLGGSK